MMKNVDALLFRTMGVQPVALRLFVIFTLAITTVAQVARAQSSASPDDALIRSRSPLLEKINTATGRGVKFLLSRQNADGSWSETGNHQVGETALATLALLNSGESPTSPQMAKAIDWLRKHKSPGTYSVALRACVFATLPESMRGGDLRGDLNWLLGAIELKRGDPNEGMYSYGPASNRGGGGDFSNTQYGVLGVWYAQLSGLEVPTAYWKRVEDCWLRAQSADGGWGYTQDDAGRPYSSMTAAGAATLYITNDYLHAADAEDLNRLPHNAPLDLAIRWLGEHFAVDRNSGLERERGRFRQPEDGAGGARWGNYLLFAYERVGEASGFTRFADHRWFEAGANYLLPRQLYDGSFPGDMGELIDTSYALLFLSRGRSPVLVQKLQFGTRWNNRPLDVSNFVHFMRFATERHTNWQVVSIDAPIEDWRESPILYIASDRALTVTDEQRDRIAEYVHEGGLLVFVNEGAGSAFEQSATVLCKTLWPTYSFKDVPTDNPIRKGNFPTSSWTLPIRSLSNGVREMAVMFPSGDASWKWQSNGGALTVKLSPFAPLANLSLYVSGKFVPSYKGETTWIARDPNAHDSVNELYTARLRHAGNWNPEPLAWQRLANVFHNAGDAELKVSEISANAAELRQAFALVDLTSTDAISFKPEEEAAIKAYLDKGGLLFFDAAGSSTAAAVTFEALMSRLYPAMQSAPLPVGHAIYLGDFPGGRKLQTFRYRSASQHDLPATTLPRLRGYTLNNRLIAIASNEDVTAGMVGYTTAEITGYSPSSAITLMRNVVLWAGSRGKK